MGLSNSRLIFCFGSNESGIHGAGAAKYAVEFFGAEAGIGYGFTGYSFAIPTKDYEIQTLPLESVQEYAEQFKADATANPELVFAMTKIGCGLAGFTDDQIAPLFEDAPKNVDLPVEWAVRHKRATWKIPINMLAKDYPKLKDRNLFMFDQNARGFVFRNNPSSDTIWFQIDPTKPVSLQIYESLISSELYQEKVR